MQTESKFFLEVVTLYKLFFFQNKFDKQVETHDLPLDINFIYFN
jgi:hypothetical protein